MAKVSNELDVREAMGLTGEAQEKIENAEWVILDCAPDFKYVDGKNGFTEWYYCFVGWASFR